MKIPFTTEEFLSVFADYNQAVWPMQFLLLAAGLVAVLAVEARWLHRDRIVTGILAFLWAWAGTVYHLGFFARINPAAEVFGLLFLLQAIYLFRFSVQEPGVHFSPGIHPVRRGFGALLIVYALIIYPLIGVLSGRHWPALPTFGVPCPLALFTFGVLLWTRRPCPRGLLVIPAIWAVIGGSAAVLLDVPEDLALPIAAGIALYNLWPRRDEASTLRGLHVPE
jgi:hypothetical protein